MRLIDELRAAPGGLNDRLTGGAFTSMAKALRGAQCFELGPDVVAACAHVTKSRPSSLLSALPMTRVPYPRTWFEWVPPDEDEPPTATRPRPDRIG